MDRRLADKDLIANSPLVPWQVVPVQKKRKSALMVLLSPGRDPIVNSLLAQEQAQTFAHVMQDFALMVLLSAEKDPIVNSQPVQRTHLASVRRMLKPALMDPLLVDRAQIANSLPVNNALNLACQLAVKFAQANHPPINLVSAPPMTSLSLRSILANR